MRRRRQAGDRPVSMRFGARRNGRVVIAAVAMVALLATAAGTTIAFGRDRPDRTTRLVTEQPAAQVPVFSHVVPAPAIAAPTEPTSPQTPAAASSAADSPRRSAGPVRRPARPPVPCAAPPAVPATSTIAASAIGSSVAVFDAPNGRLVRSLPSPTRDNQRLHLRVVGSRGAEWLQVQMAERPNGVTGWIQSFEVDTSLAENRILIERCARRLTVFRAGQPVLRFPVAVGKSGTPTPLGDFYVDFLEKWQPSSKYGPWLLSVSGFSEVYQTFGKGGIGQIGIHGTQARTSVGRPTSNGCIRMHNEAISQLATIITPGTPVLIAP